MISYLGFIFGAVGVVLAVVAIMMSVESSRKMARLIHARFQQSELELMKGLDSQDQEMKRQRRTLGEAIQTMEERFAAQSATMNQLQSQMDEVRGVRRVIPSDEERGFTKKKPDAAFS